MSAVTVKTVLFVCGSFNPPTNMHLRMFELARDHLYKLGYNVCGGIMSPVHDKYGKKDLVSSNHRCEMVKIALENINWIKLSDWESSQKDWTRTRVSIEHQENELNNCIKHNSCDKLNIKRARHDSVDKIKVMLLCGADVLESMGVPGLWSSDDIAHLAGHHGIVVITRGSSNPAKFIYENDILSKHMDKIIIVNEWITNEISSTNIRRALSRGDSVKYLINENVEQYIYQNALYSVVESPHTEISILNYLNNFNNNKTSSSLLLLNNNNKLILDSIDGQQQQQQNNNLIEEKQEINEQKQFNQNTSSLQRSKSNNSSSTVTKTTATTPSSFKSKLKKKSKRKTPLKSRKIN